MSSPSGDVKINRLKAKNKADLNVLGSVLAPEVLHRAVPRIAAAEEYRAEKKAMVDTLSAFARYSKAGGFDPTRTYQYVANIDSSVWSAILETFARYDGDGNLVHDGLLYKPNPRGGEPILNRDFFYMLLQYLESIGYKCDMRAKIVV